MNKFNKFLLIGLTTCGLLTACLTSKTVSTSSTGVTTTNTVVNQANLLLDTSVLQGATAVAVSVAVQKDPTTIPILKNTALVLDGVLNGANSNSASQVIGLLGTNSNPVLVAEITPLIGTISGLEQSLLQKYGTNVSSQISLAIAKSVDAGLVIGLAGK